MCLGPVGGCKESAKSPVQQGIMVGVHLLELDREFCEELMLKEKMEGE